MQVCDLNGYFLQSEHEERRMGIFNSIPAKYQSGDSTEQKTDINLVVIDSVLNFRSFFSSSEAN